MYKIVYFFCVFVCECVTASLMRNTFPEKQKLNPVMWRWSGQTSSHDLFITHETKAGEKMKPRMKRRMSWFRFTLEHKERRDYVRVARADKERLCGHFTAPWLIIDESLSRNTTANVTWSEQQRRRRKGGGAGEDGGRVMTLKLFQAAWGAPHTD